MGKVFRSLGIIAGLSGLTGTTQALEVVDWGEQFPGTRSLPSPLTATVLPTPQALNIVGGAASLRPSWGEGPNAPLPAGLAAGTTPLPMLERQPGTDGGSPVLAGLAAVAFLMWRRLRRR